MHDGLDQIRIAGRRVRRHSSSEVNDAVAARAGSRSHNVEIPPGRAARTITLDDFRLLMPLTVEVSRSMRLNGWFRTAKRSTPRRFALTDPGGGPTSLATRFR